MFTKRMFAGISALVVGAAVAVGIAGNAAQAADKLIIGIMVAKEDPHTKGAEYFAKRLMEETKGALKVEVFSDGVLGNEVELIEGIKRGTVDITVASPGNLSSFVPEYQILDIPFVFRDRAHWEAVTRGPVGKEMNAMLEKKGGIKVLGTFGGSMRNIISRTEPMTSLAKIKDIKMRVWQAPVIINFWKSLGTVPSVVAYKEVYTALQTGVVDAAENEVPTFLTQKWYEPSKFIALSKHSFTVRPFIMGAKQFNKLSKEHQDLVVRLGAETAAYQNKVEHEFGDNGLKSLEAKHGIKLVNVVDRPKWIEATKGVREEQAKKLGVTDLLQRLYAAGT